MDTCAWQHKIAAHSKLNKLYCASNNKQYCYNHFITIEYALHSSGYITKMRTTKDAIKDKNRKNTVTTERQTSPSINLETLSPDLYQLKTDHTLLEDEQEWPLLHDVKVTPELKKDRDSMPTWNPIITGASKDVIISQSEIRISSANYKMLNEPPTGDLKTLAQSYEVTLIKSMDIPLPKSKLIVTGHRLTKSADGYEKTTTVAALMAPTTPELKSRSTHCHAKGCVDLKVKNVYQGLFCQPHEMLIKRYREVIAMNKKDNVELQVRMLEQSLREFPHPIYQRQIDDLKQSLNKVESDYVNNLFKKLPLI